jgi:thymidylate synthase (FAD)
MVKKIVIGSAGASGSVELLEHMGSDLSVVRNARQSYNAEWRTGVDKGSDERLIRYLNLNDHTSPFESVTATFGVCCPIFVARQWFRHRTASYNEVSGRYTTMDFGVWVPHKDHIGKQSKDNKQCREVSRGVFDRTQEQIQEKISESLYRSQEDYQDLIGMGCPKELARVVLPLATMTKFSVTSNLLNFLKFIKLRDHPHAQLEIQEYARAMKEILSEVFPVSVRTFEEARNA